MEYISITHPETYLASLPRSILRTLLMDRTTNRPIIWATRNVRLLGQEVHPLSHISPEVVSGQFGQVIKPRAVKELEEQLQRTRDKGECFTPSYIVNIQNNAVDEIWFGRKDVFNTEIDNGWLTNFEMIQFPKNKSWKSYVHSKRLEAASGECPYLTSRYDSVSFQLIPVTERVGILDRKLRIVSENTDTKKEWIRWALSALRATYGFELQGDNLVLARTNLLCAFVECCRYNFGEDPDYDAIKKAALIISWNMFQMDGISHRTPGSRPLSEKLQMPLDLNFDDASKPGAPLCIIRDWSAKRCVTYSSLLER